MLTQSLGNAITPELIEVFATRIGKGQTHFQPVRLHEVQRSQQSIQTRKNTQMLLREGQFVRAQSLCLQPRVDVTLEGQHRLFGLLQRKVGLPIHEALVIQGGDFLRYPHQVLNILRVHLTGALHQRRSLINK